MSIKFGPALSQLLAEPRLPELGPGRPDQTRRNELERLIHEAIFSSGEIKDQGLGRACCAGLWLHFDFLDEAHQISQELETPEGSSWHGIMHRREGDFANASYWFRRAGDLPFFGELGLAAAQLLASITIHPLLTRLEKGDAWDPYRFVDICKACSKGNLAIEQTCRKLQRLEWDHLFGFCYAAGLNAGPHGQTP
jgi:hypothetical protein